LKNSLRHGARTFIRLLVAGAFTGIVDQLAGGLSAQSAALVLAAWQIVLTFAQTSLEESGKVPVILPTAGSPSSSLPNPPGTELPLIQPANETTPQQPSA
jgi:hypothetical protein